MTEIPPRIGRLVEAAAEVVGSTDLATLLDHVVETGMELTGARYGALGVLGDHGALVEFRHHGLDDADAGRIGHLPRGAGVLGTITATGKTVRLEDLSEHPDSVGFPAHHPPMTTFLGVPVRVGDRVFGNLYLTDKPGGFTEDDEIMVELLASTAGSAVSTMRLHERLRRAALHEDRERIARDLHDSIIQDLFAVGLGLQASMAQVATDPNGVRDRLDDAVERLDETISSLRRFIFDLRPPVWSRPGLDTELHDLVEELARPYDIPVVVDTDERTGSIDPDLGDHILAVTKEAVSNALRHSRASEIVVTVRSDEDTVALTITDDGGGFDTSVVGSGMGLSNMRERVTKATGLFRITSDTDWGTAVKATFPIG